MLILAIDTSAVASAALVSDDAPESVLASFATEDTRTHAEVLAPGIDGLLAEAGVSGHDVDAIVTGVGPGPFTGLRSGIVTARTLAFVWGKPLYGVVSLDAIALEVAESTDSAVAAAQPQPSQDHPKGRSEAEELHEQLEPGSAAATRSRKRKSKAA